MPTMSAEQRMSFLSEPHAGVLAVDWSVRAPLSVPVWYDYEPAGDVVLWTYSNSVKHKLIRAAGRFSLTVQQDTLPYRFVTAQGPVVSTTPGDRDLVHKMAARYFSESAARVYAERDYVPDSVTIRMRPEHWLSGVFLEDEIYR